MSTKPWGYSSAGRASEWHAGAAERCGHPLPDHDRVERNGPSYRLWRRDDNGSALIWALIQSIQGPDTVNPNGDQWEHLWRSTAAPHQLSVRLGGAPDRVDERCARRERLLPKSERLERCGSPRGDPTIVTPVIRCRALPPSGCWPGTQPTWRPIGPEAIPELYNRLSEMRRAARPQGLRLEYLTVGWHFVEIHGQAAAPATASASAPATPAPTTDGGPAAADAGSDAAGASLPARDDPAVAVA